MVRVVLVSVLGFVLGVTMMQASDPNPVGKILPSVTGHALSRERVTFPDDLAGRPAVLLVAYRRSTQSDVDRWMGFLKERAPRTIRYEVPAIAGIIWRPMAGWIDSGMRGGVPPQDWAGVVTLYEDAPKLRDFLGDQGGYTAHVALVDREGKVVWFNASGFSERSAASFLEALQALDAETPR